MYRSPPQQLMLMKSAGVSRSVMVITNLSTDGSGQQNVFYYYLYQTISMTMTMTIFYSIIDIQIETIMYNSLENQIINWSGDYY